jgi:hypothetical protein
MTGKRYYIATLGAWQRHAARFANSHFIALDSPPPNLSADAACASHTSGAAESGAGNCDATGSQHAAAASDATPILVLVEAEEGVHLALEDDPAFEPLPHPLAQKSISAAAQAALAPHGVAPGASTFDAAETVARLHPLLRHRVF